MPLLFFWRLVTPVAVDRMHIAAGDFTEQYFPLRAFTAQQWVTNQVPLWNPYLYGGQPALADIQSGALYPPHIIEALLLGWGAPVLGYESGFPLRALEWQVIFHVSLAAVGTYLFTRHFFLGQAHRLRSARFGGVIASLVFTYSGYLTGFPVQQITILATAAWLPWVLWGLDKAFWQAGAHLSLKPALPATIGAALAFALAILAGHPQTLLYIVYLTLAYTLFQALFAWRQTGPTAGRSPAKGLLTRSFAGLFSRFFLLWLAIIIWGGALAAAQLLPTLEFIALSLRSDLSFQAVSAGLPLNELISMIYPGFLGGSPQYVGIITLVLVALGLRLAWAHFNLDIASRPIGVSSDGEKDQPPTGFPAATGSPSPAPIFFWAGAGLISLLLAFGRNLFVYPLFYLFAPGFDAVRQQERVLLIFSLSAAILAGYGAMVWTEPLPPGIREAYRNFEKRLRTVAALALGLTAFYIYGATSASARGDEVNLFFGVLQHHILGLIILGGVLGLFVLRSRRGLRRWWAMALIAAWLSFNLFSVNWRFNLEKRQESSVFTSGEVVQFLQTRLTAPVAGSDQGDIPAAVGRIVSGGLLPGGNNAASVHNLQDLTGNTPLQLARVEAFLSQMPAWRLWQLMNVRYIVDQRDLTGEGLSLVFEAGDLKVFEMGDPFERAWFVSQTELVADDQQALERLASDEFDLRRAAIISQPLDMALTGATTPTVAVTRLGTSRLNLAVNSSGRQLLILSQIYYPGWRATIDGQPAELLRVNLVQQGLVVPPGDHLIELSYWPDSFRIGLIGSALGVVLCGVTLIWTAIRR